MDIKEAKFILANSPPFNKLRKEDLDDFIGICELRHYRQADVIYKDQDPPDYFYFLLRGRVLVLTPDIKGESVIELLKRGTSFGIISLFNDEPHSVTTKSIEDSFIFRVEKEKFKNFLNNHPLISLDFYRTLSQRIRARSGRKKIFQCKRIAVAGQRNCGKTTYVFNLGVRLKNETRKNVVCLELVLGKEAKLNYFFKQKEKMLELSEYNEENIQEYIIKANTADLNTDYLIVNITETTNFPALLNYLSENYHFIIYEIPSELFNGNFYEIIAPADYFHFLIFTNKENILQASYLIKDIESKNPVNTDKIKVILDESGKDTRLPTKEIKEILGHSIYATLPYPDNPEYLKAIRRISRETGEVLVGLALGAGGAYGFSHIGVLRVLEQNDIPIDIICGSSVGSVIAALWALGYDAEHIEKAMIEFAKKVNPFSFRGFSLPFRGLWKAKYLESILKKIFKDKTFYDLKHPLKIVVFDFLKKDTKILEDGPLYRAVAASCALPGLFEPISFRGEVFLDGGVLNPLPTKTLLNYGANKIIAVNIAPSQEEIMKEYNKRNKFHILDFIFGSIETMQRQFIEQALMVADVVIHPNFENLKWLEFEKVTDFISKGEVATKQKLAELKKLVNI